MSSKKYNGFSNRETWKTFLEYYMGQNSMDYGIEPFHENENGDQREYKINKLSSIIEDNFRNEMSEKVENSFLSSIIDSFINKVNFLEISELLLED